jgi:hypothetical protein
VSVPHFGEIAARLAENGYQPLPVHWRRKNPCAGEAWQNYSFSDPDAERFKSAGTGLLCGRVIAVDIDVRSPELARKIERLAEEALGRAPRRIGQPPKVLCLYQAEKPFGKMATRGYHLPADQPEDKSHRVEILAKGQQFVAFNIHPDTGKPYEWNGLGSPLSVPIGLLPSVSESQARDFISQAERLLASHGEPVGRLVGADDEHFHEPNEKLEAADQALLRDALRALPNDDLEFDDWCRVLYAVKGALGDAGLDDFLSWSAKSEAKHVPSFAEKEYRAAKPRRIGAGTIFFLAERCGWKRPAPASAPNAPRETLPRQSDSKTAHDDLPPVECYEEDHGPQAAIRRAVRPQASSPSSGPQELHLHIDWASLEGKDPPPRDWVIPEWIPASHTTLLAGKGGIGKTLLAQHIATALAAGKGYISQSQEPKRVLMWAGEDDERELWWRQRNICSFFGLRLSDIAERFRLHSYAGSDITLASPVFGTLERTPMLSQLTAQVAQFAPDLVILDNIARIYGGNENERHAVTTFVAWVQSACAPAAVLLLGHPAKIAGSEFSGSTAWEGSVRSRLYLGDKLPDAREDDDDNIPDPKIRYFAKRKANYSELDLKRFSLIDGVFVPSDSPSSAAAPFSPDSEAARETVRYAVEALAERDFYGSASTASPAYLPRLAKQYGLLGLLTERQFVATMRAMVMAKRLVSEKVGAYKNRTAKFGLVHHSTAKGSS